MLYPSEQISSINKANMELTKRLTALALESTEQLFKLQLDAAARWIDKQSDHLKVFIPGESASTSGSDWANLYQAQPKKSFEAWQTGFEMACTVQSKLIELMNEHVVAVNQCLSENVKEVTGAWASDAAGALVKSAAATSSVSEAGTKISRKAKQAA